MISPIFKYIFALIVGALFIIFFINFAKDYMTTSELQTSGESVTRFINTLNTFSAAEDSYNNINLGLEIDIIFNCNTITINQISKDSQHVIFAPLKIKNKKLDLWTKQFIIEDFLPITNFFYITDDKHQYVLVFDSLSHEYVEKIYKKFPKEFNILRTHKDNIDDIPKTDKTKYIYFTQTLVENELTIDIENNLAYFPETTNIFLNQEMLIGAILAEDSEQYQCSLDLTLQKTRNIAQLYLRKITYLRQKQPNCDYTPIHNTLTLIKTLEIEQINEKIALLKEQNLRLLDNENCITLI